MKVVAVYKWARDPEDAAVRTDGSIDWRGARMAAGEDDPAVLEVARALATAGGGSTIGLTIGDGDATWALARGLEAAVVIPDAVPCADNARTAAVLAAAVRRIGDVDVVVIGDAEAYAGVAPALAGHLGWPAMVGVSGAAVDGLHLRLVRRLGAMEQVVRLPLPAVIGVAAAGAEKQQPGMKEVLAARKRPVTSIALDELAVASASHVEWRSTRAPALGAARLFTGDPGVAAAQLVSALRADGVL